MAQAEGIVLPDDLYYHPEDHLWVRLEGDRARVGLDALAQRSAGTVGAVRLKPPGRPVAAGKPFGTMEAGKYVGPLKAPISGRVVEVNEEVMSRPSLLNSDPYDRGWLIVLEPEDAPRDLAALVHGEGVHPWLERSIDDWRRRGLLKG
ncbi:MAG: glycine cleavage system protein H [Sphingomonadaceae bacterium]